MGRLHDRRRPRARADRGPRRETAPRLQRQLASHKLLIVDELGYVPLSQIGAELLFEVLSQRYERGATIVTSNLPFDEWTSMFGSERLTCLMTLPLAPALVAGAFLCAQWIETSRSLRERGGVLNSHNWK